MAATGVGAGDLIAASVAGARYGTVILWAALIGAILKFTLNEGLARWQLATGTTLLEGWVSRLPRVVSIYFMIYLVLWTFIVSGALMAACGLAAHAMVPALPVSAWGAIHAVIATVLVFWGRYIYLEWAMKLFIGLMFVVIIACAFMAFPGVVPVLSGLFIPRVPEGSGPFILGVIGGVGGSVTLLSYGYWIREKHWTRPQQTPLVRLDLAVGYVLTGLFGIAIMIVSAGVKPDVMSGSGMVLEVANHMGALIGDGAKWMFLIGFWGAVFSSMLGVWHGIPYLFSDFYRRMKNQSVELTEIGPGSLPYRLFLLYIALPPMVLLFVGKPVWIVVIYAVSGAFFMPFLASLLLYMNNKKAWLGEWINSWKSNIFLAAALLLFAVLLVFEIQRRMG